MLFDSYEGNDILNPLVVTLNPQGKSLLAIFDKMKDFPRSLFPMTENIFVKFLPAYSAFFLPSGEYCISHPFLNPRIEFMFMTKS